MITSGINFINFKIKKKSNLVKKFFFSLLEKKNEVLNSLSKEYKNSFNKKAINKQNKTDLYAGVFISFQLPNYKKTLEKRIMTNQLGPLGSSFSLLIHTQGDTQILKHNKHTMHHVYR